MGTFDGFLKALPFPVGASNDADACHFREWWRPPLPLTSGAPISEVPA